MVQRRTNAQQNKVFTFFENAPYKNIVMVQHAPQENIL